MARTSLICALLVMILAAHVYQAHGGSCGCPKNSDKCEQNCIKKNPNMSNVKGACKGTLYLYCKCSVNGEDWYSIAGSC
ncbi:unnamed protein product [Rotaria sp. Silwood1]|nr:unnamed protein product [Rotaria sp. Silwood1]